MKKNGNQNIKCTVETCKYNDTQKNCCSLEQIHVAPMPDCETKKPDESMCNSYRYDIK